MKKLIIALLLATSLSACSNKQQIPEVSFKGTQVEDLVAKPDRELMRKADPKQKLVKGMDNGQSGIIISNNNLRAASIERRLTDLQQYVCNLFKDPVGEVCVKDGVNPTDKNP